MGLLLLSTRLISSIDKLDSPDEPKPTVVIGKLDAVMRDNPNIMAKNEMLLDYIDKNDYNKVFESDRFTVYAVGSEE